MTETSNYLAIVLLHRYCKTMQLMLDISDEVLERVKRVAASESIALDTLAEEGLRMALQRHERLKAGPITPLVVGGNGTVPDLSWTHLSELLYGG